MARILGFTVLHTGFNSVIVYNNEATKFVIVSYFLL